MTPCKDWDGESICQLVQDFETISRNEIKLIELPRNLMDQPNIDIEERVSFLLEFLAIALQQSGEFVMTLQIII